VLESLVILNFVKASVSKRMWECSLCICV